MDRVRFVPREQRLTVAAMTGGTNAERAELRITLMGGLASVSRHDGSSVPLGRIDAALLAVLAIEGGTTRQRLLQLLWPDDEPESARNALRQRLFRLRQAIGAELVVGGA